MAGTQGHWGGFFSLKQSQPMPSSRARTCFTDLERAASARKLEARSKPRGPLDAFHSMRRRTFPLVSQTLGG